MKNRVICSRLELVHISDIEKMENNNIEFKPDKNFLQLTLEGNADYSSQSQNTKSGKILNETISAKIKYESDLPFCNHALKYYILKLYTDSGPFVVGSIDYPTELSYNDNKLVINLNFKASSPIL